MLLLFVLSWDDAIGCVRAAKYVKAKLFAQMPGKSTPCGDPCRCPPLIAKGDGNNSSERVCSFDGLIWLSSKAQKWLLAEPFHLQHCDTGAEGFEDFENDQEDVLLRVVDHAGSAIAYQEMRGKRKKFSFDKVSHNANCLDGQMEEAIKLRKTRFFGVTLVSHCGSCHCTADFLQPGDLERLKKPDAPELT
ncbi:hypothetical protein OPV22_027664 [Ensete ventricosum]|uniref:Uncharacterized protein n=1 Tax=Ensete ventricosum TaxID=4639 RepID=A0AAV8PW97_ENSVE|nr:hypothetical protein OPV22_027664 [Ensete ventricosum]